MRASAASSVGLSSCALDKLSHGGIVKLRPPCRQVRNFSLMRQNAMPFLVNKSALDFDRLIVRPNRARRDKEGQKKKRMLYSHFELSPIVGAFRPLTTKWVMDCAMAPLVSSTIMSWMKALSIFNWSRGRRFRYESDE